MIWKSEGPHERGRAAVFERVMRQQSSTRAPRGLREARRPREDPMVDKTVTQSPNVIVLSRYRARNEGSRAPALSVRLCRHCGAKLMDDEREEECSAIFNADIARLLRLRWQAAQILRGLN
jgi:hypothetical protein